MFLCLFRKQETFFMFQSCVINTGGSSSEQNMAVKTRVRRALSALTIFRVFSNLYGYFLCDI